MHQSNDTLLIEKGWLYCGRRAAETPLHTLGFLSDTVNIPSRARLETGRTHQIRVHMSYIKHPIVGDPCTGAEDRNLT